MTNIGHNSTEATMRLTSSVERALRQFVERIERLEEEKASIAGDIKEVYAEAKANGFDTKILRMVIARRKKDANELRETEAMLDVYLSALGMLKSAIEQRSKSK